MIAGKKTLFYLLALLTLCCPPSPNQGNAQYGQQQEAYQQGPPQQQGYPPQQQYPGQQGYPPQQQGYGELCALKHAHMFPSPVGGAVSSLWPPSSSVT